MSERQPASGGSIDDTVLRVWTEVLKAEPDGPATHFFDFGGHSLAAMRAVTRLRRDLSVPVPTRLIFDHPVLSDFTAQVRTLVETAAQ
ncbi:phosphopantetheine-binding protein [Streptomyces sp. NPDC020490]|uniref:phosphopantetheine-binding protein n=1 Tax=Streptomyces sp. NPDC020490 TaxID=3365078 RepID=UPI0037B2C31E